MKYNIGDKVKIYSECDLDSGPYPGTIVSVSGPWYIVQGLKNKWSCLHESEIIGRIICPEYLTI